MPKTKLNLPLLIGLLLLLGLALAACQPATPTAGAPDTPQVTEPPVTAPTEEEAQTQEAPAAPGEVEVPFLAEWQSSAHADAASESFTHWDEEDPAEIPANCAKCHSATGFQDYAGADGSEALSVDANHPVGTVITCTACHNNATMALDTVVFPSGVQMTGLGPDTICSSCHQGTASEAQVNANIESAGMTEDLDTPSENLAFTNIHYYAAAVSRYGTVVNGGYQYDDRSYDHIFEHAIGVDQCVDCHNPHSLEVKVESCGECHRGVETVEDIRNIREVSSLRDYDGDGDIEEGMYYEVEGLRQLLYETMQAYAANVAGTPLVYSESAYPYFFIDTNGDGELGEDEAGVPNRYNAWTARLVKAAFNFQTATKDPGGYVHGGKYIIQLLYDSIEDLNQALGENATDLTGINRVDPGHFDGSSEAFRHWDAEGAVPASCAKCHSADGLPIYLQEGANLSVDISNGMQCETCHNSLQEFTFYEVESVRFPSGAVIGFEEDLPSNLCLQCHQGRESTTSVNARLGNAPDDEPVEGLSFINVHYFVAGATLFGTDAKGVYEYAGQEYSGQFMHIPAFDSCAECHDAHQLDVQAAACQGCHLVDDPRDMRQNMLEDYDGDGDSEEGLAYEVETMQETLFAALQAYAAETLNTPIAYNPNRHPYFFVDDNGNGVADPEETTRYASWSPRLLRAAYNYQYVLKDPGAYAHNPAYVLQVLYDSIADLGGDVSGMIRPPVE